MAYSIYAYVDRSALQQNPIDSYLQEYIDNSPWILDSTFETHLFLYCKPRYETFGNTRVKPFLDFVDRMNEQGFLRELTEDEVSNNSIKEKMVELAYNNLIEIL